ncbi:MAG: TetR/AcrR family transcriptional regulator [Solirubrobacteraceae bacterium]
MRSFDTHAPKPGLRERKKQQTRETIARAALLLFAKRGFGDTTLAEIAEAADVSPRTIFAYFDSKEDILFAQESTFLAELKRRLDERPEGSTTIDALREFVSSLTPLTEEGRLCKEVVAADPELQMKQRARYSELQPMLAESIAKDLDTGPADIRPLLVAASMIAALTSVRDSFVEAKTDGTPMSHEQSLAVIDQLLEFMRGGLEAMRHRDT